MDKPTLTIDQLKNHLGTDLICLLDYGGESYFDKLEGIYCNGDLLFSEDQGDTHTIDEVKPICYRLSDLHKFYPKRGIRSLGDQMGLNEKFKKENILAFESGNMRLHHYRLLWKHHFWTGPQEYFEQGLLIDKMTFRKEAPNV